MTSVAVLEDTASAPTFRTVSEIREANQAAGLHFFDPSSMRFFDSRVLAGVIGGRYFVTSERFTHSDGTADPRRYTVRSVDSAGRIDTVGEFQEWSTPGAARAAALVAASFPGTEAQR